MARTGSSWEKYISKMQITTQLIPFKRIFSPACGGSQKLVRIMKITKMAGVTTIALYIEELRWIVRL
jgi:hypothetical protein